MISSVICMSIACFAVVQLDMTISGFCWSILAFATIVSASITERIFSCMRLPSGTMASEMILKKVLLRENAGSESGSACVRLSWCFILVCLSCMSSSFLNGEYFHASNRVTALEGDPSAHTLFSAEMICAL